MNAIYLREQVEDLGGLWMVPNKIGEWVKSGSPKRTVKFMRTHEHSHLLGVKHA